MNKIFIEHNFRQLPHISSHYFCPIRYYVNQDYFVYLCYLFILELMQHMKKVLKCA